MSEKKTMRFRRDPPEEKEPENKGSLSERIEQARKNSETSEIFPSKTTIDPPVTVTAPIKNQTTDRRIIKADTPRDVPGEIQALLGAYKGDLVKVQEFILTNFEGVDLYTAGFQICLILTNERIARENALREIFENMRRGVLKVPFDPREDPMVISLFKKISIPRERNLWEPPIELIKKETPGIPEKKKSVLREDFTTKDEQLSSIHNQIDEIDIGRDGVSQ